MEPEWIRVEQLRVHDTFRVEPYTPTYVCVSHPRMGAFADTTVVETGGGLMTFRLGAIVEILPADD